MRPFVTKREISVDDQPALAVKASHIEIEYPSHEALAFVIYIIPKNESTAIVASCWEHCFDELSELQDGNISPSFAANWPVLNKLLEQGRDKECDDLALRMAEDIDYYDTKWLLMKVGRGFSFEGPEELIAKGGAAIVEEVLEESYRLLLELTENDPNALKNFLPYLHEGEEPSSTDSTTKKGDEFEERVFDAVERELQGGHLGVIPDSCRLFRKKKYYSPARKSTIEIDISIEVWLPGMKNWSMLWAIECKSYRRAIPVDDVEEFCAKVEQIAGKNVKATLVTRGALQKGAFNYALSKGISVVRLLPLGQILYVLPRLMPDSDSLPSYELTIEDVSEALTKPHFEGHTEFFCRSSDCYHIDWRSLMGEVLKQ